MKNFIYDNLLTAENLCNLEKEKQQIRQGISEKRKLVVYGRRNTGKTSLLKNIIIPEFKEKHKESFVLFCDLMQVKNMESLSVRFQADFAKSFKESFPAKSLVEKANKFLKGLRPVLDFDPITGMPSFEITSVKNNKVINFTEIFDIIASEISTKVPALIVLDEFQDISFVDEAEGLFRKSLQELNNVPIILMGSKKHILYNMFARPKAPFADFGTDIEFGEIPYKEYYEYIKERLAVNNISITFETCSEWQDLLFRSPEPINMTGAEILKSYSNTTITREIIIKIIQDIIEKRRSRFEEMLGRLTSAEEKILIAISKQGAVSEPSGKNFLKAANVSASGALKAISKLEDQSFLEKNKNEYFFINPFLYYFFRTYR